jgi:uncharacterized phage protein gp47/JayE
VIDRPIIQLDSREPASIVGQLLQRRLGYVPQWVVTDRSADQAIAWIFARYLYAVIQRLNQAPAKNKLAFLDLLGLSPVTAQSARAPIVFKLTAGGADSRAAAGAQIAAAPPPGSTEQIVFETEIATGLASAQLKQLVSLWPGRDQYLDHSAQFFASQAFQLFRKPLLVDTPHELYVAHDTLLALAGNVTVDVEIELTQPSSEQLSVVWQYWDGKVWRGFKSARPGCSEKDAANLDSTIGLTQSGRFLLEADCAQSKKAAVNGVQGFWIRGKLTEVLPPDPSRALPLVENIRLSTLISQPLKATLAPVVLANLPNSVAGTRIHGVVMNEAGQKLNNVDVKISSNKVPDFDEAVIRTPSGADSGSYDSGRIESQDDYDVRVSFLNLEGTGKLRNIGDDRDVNVNLTLGVKGLDPDKAFAEGTKLDVTKPFYPFGQQPQPGATFYFSQEEIFSKPGARIQIYVARTASPQDELNVTSGGSGPTALEHLIAWEYWNGEKWVTLFYSDDQGKDLDKTEIMELTVPADIEPTKVNEEEARWMRVRLVSGGFGFSQEVQWDAGVLNSFTYVVSRPPALAAFRLGYSWTYGPFNAEQVLTHNDFRYEDHTYEAKWPGVTFMPFTRIADVTPALYLGFDKKLPVDRIGLYFDIKEEKGDTEGPAVVWEYFDGSEWRGLSVQDETRNLRLPGILSFIAAEDAVSLARFGTELHWIRGRLKEDSPPGEPLVTGIFQNAVWASQRQTFNDSPLGASNGLPDQVFTLTQTPVLPGERIEVRELAGARANVEWRILALEISKGDRTLVRELEDLLGREGTQTDIVKGDLRLRRDRNKLVREAWVHWVERPHFFDSGGGDRHYVIDRARGRVLFGDGVNGKIPPPGSQILMKQFRAGGGLAGNVEAGKITQLLGALPGVESVSNPRAAEGGADGETIEKFGSRGPLSIKHRGRAITPEDYETLAKEASPAVAVARAIPTRNPSGRVLPGWVTLLIIPQSKEERPWPSFGMREQVRRYIEERAPGDLAGALQIYVTGPDYLEIDVAATIKPVNPSDAGAVEQRAREEIENFLHPLTGGPEGKGWELGRDVYLSDLAGVIERVEGVDYVEELALSVGEVLQGDSVSVGDDRVVAAGEIRLKLI